MKTVKDLREAVKNGSFKVGGIDPIEYEEGKDLDFKCDGSLFAWIGGSQEEERELRFALSLSSSEYLVHMDILNRFVQACGFSVGEVKPIEVTKIVTEKDSKTTFLEGQVSVYEKLTTGRRLTLEN